MMGIYDRKNVIYCHKVNEFWWWLNATQWANHLGVSLDTLAGRRNNHPDATTAEILGYAKRPNASKKGGNKVSRKSKDKASMLMRKFHAGGFR